MCWGAGAIVDAHVGDIDNLQDRVYKHLVYLRSESIASALVA